jgi:hypothetical protein
VAAAIIEVFMSSSWDDPTFKFAALFRNLNFGNLNIALLKTLLNTCSSTLHFGKARW